MPRSDPGWTYYDDILWWALALLRCSDMYQSRGTAEPHMIAVSLTKRAADIFEHVASRAWNDTKASCGGGIYWSTHHSYKNAIANELFLMTAAKLNRTDWALREWEWFESSGMINTQSLVNDGLDSKCNNNQASTYTYNQGVVLGGMWHLFALTGNVSLLLQGERIADAVMALLTEDGILAETGCGDGALFKGIFVRYLRYFMQAPINSTKRDNYNAFLTHNANSAWANSQDVEGKFGGWWSGSSAFESASVGLQVAGIDLLVAARRSSFPKSAPRQCSDRGQWVHDRCICETRFVGASCQKQIRWDKYYSNRRVVLMSSSGRFVSSGQAPNRSEPQPLRPTQSHLSEQEKLTVVPCSGGVGLRNSGGLWVTVTTAGGGKWGIVAAESGAFCSTPNGNTTFVVSEDSNGMVKLQSVLAANLYLGTVMVGAAEHVVVQQAMQGGGDLRFPLMVGRFKVSLDQRCQDF